MLKNYIALISRQLARYKSYVAVNVLGLSAAVAVSILAFLNWKHNADFDRFHTKGDRIFRVGINKEGSGVQQGICPAPLAQAALKGISGVQAACRWDSRQVILKNGTEVWTEKVHYTDGNFLDIFDFRILSGGKDLGDKSKIWLTPDMAQKYFGNENPVGATLLINAGEPDQQTLTVGGVVQKPPTNSSLQFDFLTSFENLNGPGNRPVDAGDWTWLTDAVFLLLEKPEQAPAVQQSLATFVDIQKSVRHDDLKAQSYWMEAMPQVSRHRFMRGNNLRENAGPEGIFAPLAMALLLLLTASLNFANTTIAVSNRRLREIGLRKVLGGAQGQLIGQLLLECCVLVMGSVLLGVGISCWLIPGWNAMWSFMQLEINLLHNPPLWAFLAGITVFTTLLAGSYPAFYLSSFRPAIILRGILQYGGRNLFSRFLLAVQIMIALISIVAGVSFSKQADFMKSYPTQYSAENVIAVPIGKEEQYEVLKNALAANPDITAIAGCRTHLSSPGYRKEVTVDGQQKDIRINDAGAGYLQLMDVNLVEGQLFDAAQRTEDRREIVVNEKFVEQMGWKNTAIGQTIQIDSQQYAIAGVIKNVVNTFFEPVEPLAIQYIPEEAYQTLVVKCRPEQLPAVQAEIKTVWNNLFPFQPYTGYYNSELLAQSMSVTNNIRKIFLLFSLATIILTLTSLFALLQLHTLKRMKEVAIRRVLGASGGSIAYLLHRNFIFLLVAGMAAGCLAGMGLTNVFMNSIFKINTGVSADALVFSAAGFAVLAALAVGTVLWRVMRTNPAEVLKSE